MTKLSLIRFFLGTDNSSHVYVVPVARRAEWECWSNLPEDDEASWSPPEWATRIDGAHSITFTDWAESDGDINTPAPTPAAPKTHPIALKDLVGGPYLLKGVDTPAVGEHKLGDWIRFNLDDQVFEATRDDCDEYRSSLRDIVMTDTKVTNTFRGVKVTARMKTERRDAQEWGSEWDVLQLVHVKTGKVVLEVGTDESDSYYPSWEAHWWPERLKA